MVDPELRHNLARRMAQIVNDAKESGYRKLEPRKDQIASGSLQKTILRGFVPRHKLLRDGKTHTNKHMDHIVEKRICV